MNLLIMNPLRFCFFFLLAAVSFLPSVLHAEWTGVVEPLIVSGSDDQRIVFVISSDGFVEEDKDEFFYWARRAARFFARTSPYRNYINMFNVYALFVPSEFRGLPTKEEDANGRHSVFGLYTYLEGEYSIEVGYSHYVQSDRRVQIIASFIPKFDFCYVIANEELSFGGAFLDFGVQTKCNGPYRINIDGEIRYFAGVLFDNVFVHELGHMIGALDDEYVGGLRQGKAFRPKYKYANTSPKGSPLNELTWAHWVEDLNALELTKYIDGSYEFDYTKGYDYMAVEKARVHPVGSFAGASSKSYYWRSTYRSLMNVSTLCWDQSTYQDDQEWITDEIKENLHAVDVPYGVVNEEAIVREVWRRFPVDKNLTPSPGNYWFSPSSGSSVRFAFECPEIIEGEQVIVDWYVDGHLVAKDTTSIEIDLSRLRSDSGTRISVQIFDPTEKVRFDPGYMLENVFHWDLHPSATAASTGLSRVLDKSAIPVEPIVRVDEQSSPPEGLVLSGSSSGREMATAYRSALPIRAGAIYPRHQSIVNLSARGWADNGENSMIVGFVLRAPHEAVTQHLVNQRYKLYLHAIGNGLKYHGVKNFLRDPVMELFDGRGKKIFDPAENIESDFFSLTTILSSTSTPLLSNLTYGDSAAYMYTIPGTFTFRAKGSSLRDDGTFEPGIVLLEINHDYLSVPIYSIETTKASRRMESLINISARALVGNDEKSLICGFVMLDRDEVLIVGNGPSLGQEGIGIQNPLRAPKLQLFRNGKLLLENTDWRSDPRVVKTLTEDVDGVFFGDGDVAMSVVLEPGEYTAILSSDNGEPGIGLLSVYKTSDIRVDSNMLRAEEL